MLILSLLVSCLSCNAIRLGRSYYRPYRPYQPQTSSTSGIIGAVAVVGIAALAGTAAVAIRAYFANQRAQKQYEILERFKNDPYYDYEKLKDDARNLYFDQWSHSPTSLSGDFPAVWLEKDTTSNKNFLWWMFFSKDMKELSDRLSEVIHHLRNYKPFQADKKEYNDKYRQQSYRDERLSIEREKLNRKKR